MTEMKDQQETGVGYDTIRITSDVRRVLLDKQDDIRRRTGKKPTLSALIGEAVGAFPVYNAPSDHRRHIVKNVEHSAKTAESPNSPIYDVILLTLQGLEARVNAIHQQLGAGRSESANTGTGSVPAEPGRTSDLLGRIEDLAAGVSENRRMLNEQLKRAVNEGKE